MNGEIILTQSPAYVGLCVVGGIAVAALLYWREDKFSGTQRLGLAALRAIAVALIAFLLLGPLLRNVDTRTQKPVFLLAEDRSQSVVASVDSLQNDLDIATETLSAAYDVQRIAVGERVRTAPDTAQDDATDLAAVFQYANETFPAELLSGMLLLSDGIVNRGNDPTYEAARLAAPVFAVPLGDTTPVRDVAIREVLYNRIAYLGDRVELLVDVEATNFSGGASQVTLSAVLPSGRTRELASERVTFERPRAFQTIRFEVEPGTEGVSRYRLSASPANQERNRANNSREIYLDVLDARQRVLLLAAAPHPDLSALRQAFDGSKNFEADFALARDFDGSVADYDLVVLHRLPNRKHDLKDVLATLAREKIGRWVFTGVNATSTQLSAAQDLLSINPRANQSNEVFAASNGNFKLFSLDEQLAQTLKAYPPATAPFADFGELTAGDVLLTQRIGRVNTDFPLLAMGDVQGQKQAVFAGQDLWRWRLAEFQQTEQHEVFDGLVLATAQYLSLREDKRPFRVSSAERVYTTSDDIRLQGELYNASFQLVNEPDVSVTVTDEAGQAYTFLMDKNGEAYSLRAGRLPAGSYRYEASTSFDGQGYEANGRFTVRSLQLESIATTADWDLLTRLAQQQGGELVASGSLQSWAQALVAGDTAKPVLYQSVSTRPLIDWPWLLAFALILLALEWFFRRRLGSY